LAHSTWMDDLLYKQHDQTEQESNLEFV